MGLKSQGSLGGIVKVTEYGAGPSAGVHSKEHAVVIRVRSCKACDQDGAGRLHRHVMESLSRGPLSGIAKVAEQGAVPSDGVHSKERVPVGEPGIIIYNQDRAGGLHRHAYRGIYQRPLGGIRKSLSR